MLFIHDHTFVSDGKKLYTTGSLNQNVLDRYKAWFGTLSVYATTRAATENDKAFIRAENTVEGIDFHLVPKKNSIIHILKNYKSLKQEVAKADCVVVRMSIFGAMGVFCARKLHKPYLVEMVACPWDSLWYHSSKGKMLAPFMTILTKRYCIHASRVLYVTNEFLQRRYPSKGITVGCSDVELTDIKNDVLEKRINKIKNYEPGGTLKLCTIANIAVKYKGQDIVIRSLKKLQKLGINCEYYLIGGGDPQRLLEITAQAGVENLVHIVGPVPHEEVFRYVDQMDLYVQPSNQEGLPRAVIEAMSRGCPVVGSSTGGIPELINSEMVFKKGSEDSFIKIMKSLTKDKLLRCAKENFKKSSDYEKSYLDGRRSKFYLDFAKTVKE